MKKLKIIAILIFFIISIIAYSPISRAASLTISTSQSSAKEGDTVTITVNGSGISGRVDLSVESGNGTLSEKSVWVDNSKATTTLKINGDKDIRVLATPTDVSDSATSESYTNATSATIKVAQNTPVAPTEKPAENTETSTNNTQPAEETKKSNNANLKDLGFTPNDFKGFKPATTSYTANVPNDVEKVTVYAKTQDAKAKVTGTGAQKLNVGKNTLNVVVTAEDGTQKTYTINVTREEEKAEENNTTDQNTTTNEVADSKEVEVKGDLTKLEIEGYKINPTFSPNVYEYTLTVNKDVSDLNVVAQGANEKIKVEVAGNTNLQDGENVVTVLVYNEETKQNSTYQIKVNKEDIDVEALNEQINESVKKARKIRYILIGIIAFVLVAIIIFFIVKHRYNAQYLHEEDYEYDKDDEERINLDDEEELFNRVNKEIFNKPKKEEQIEVEEENDIEEKVEEEEPEERKEFFRTTKKRGKHF